MIALAPVFRDTAPAKINLFLHLNRRREDGYHELDSLVSFASIADDVTLELADSLSLKMDAPFASAIPGGGDNLVLKAARAFASTFPGTRTGHFTLIKNLPVASGIGGGSSDAASALRLLALANDISLREPRLMACARTLGADVPVCLERLPRLMHGIGHDLDPPLAGESHPVLLVNPGIAVETRAVFAQLGLAPGQAFAPPHRHDGQEPAGGFPILKSTRNDLEAPAMALAPGIARVMAALRASAGCSFARMSGSGATCFGIFGKQAEAKRARMVLQTAHPEWWVAQGELILPD